jgi:hypothetical protein
MEPTRNCTLIVGRSTIILRIVGRDGDLTTTHNTGEVCSSQRNPHSSHAGGDISALIRCTVPVPTPSVAAILRMPRSPFFNALRIAASAAVGTRSGPAFIHPDHGTFEFGEHPPARCNPFPCTPVHGSRAGGTVICVLPKVTVTCGCRAGGPRRRPQTRVSWVKGVRNRK